MMDQQHPKGRLGRQLRQDAVQRIALRLPEPSRRHEGTRRHSRRDADQRKLAAAAHKRKCDGMSCQRPVAAQVISAHFSEPTLGGARIGVVIAGDDGDAFGRADALKPGTGGRKFRFQRDVDEIAGNGDVVGSLRPQVRNQRVGAPERVTVVPGNHDAYARATQGRFAEMCGDYLRGDGALTAHPITFPFVRRRGQLALIGVSSAVPTRPFMATGWLGQAQRDALDGILSQLSSEPAFRVLLIHHPLRSDSRHKRLTDSDELLALLKRYGVELILHGHDHIHSTMWFDWPARPHSRGRRAIGFRDRARALSRSGVQSVFDRARWRCVAM